MSKDCYLVIGGSGVFGRHLIDALVARGDVVYAFDLIQRYDDVPFISGDLTDEEAIAHALRKSAASCIFHTASPKHGTQKDEVFYRVNVDGAKTIIAAATAAGVKKLVFTSSAGVVFHGGDIWGVDETFPYPTKPVNAYNGSKAEAEQVVIAANGKGGLLTVSLRPATIYGPGDRVMWGAYQKTYDTRMSHIQIGPNTSMNDYTFALNLVDAHLLAADQLGVNPSVAGEIFFISDDTPLPFWDFPRKTYPLLAAADPKPNPPPPKKTLAVPRWLGWWIGLFSEVVCWFLGKEPVLSRYTVMYMCVSRWHSVEKAKRVLGYRPRFTTDEGIQRSVKWWLTVRDKPQPAR